MTSAILPDCTGAGCADRCRVGTCPPGAATAATADGAAAHDHRTILSGILTVVGTELSWREIPEEYGKWETAYKRYRLWCDEGRWPRIVAALGARTQK